LATTITGLGFATWSLEYRRLGDEGSEDGEGTYHHIVYQEFLMTADTSAENQFLIY
jgi:hypothetical protein